MILFRVALACFLSVGIALAAEAGTCVIDGNTIDWNGVGVRLYGIDAPARNQHCQDDGKSWACGLAAANWLRNFLHGRKVKCQRVTTDRDGRVVAICYSGDFNVNDYMVASGYAIAKQEEATDYMHSQAKAKAAKRGIWRGTFTPPRDWRRRHPLEAAVGDQGCPANSKSTRRR